MDRSWQKFEDGVEIDSGFHEVSWEEVRRVRDAALLECDWRALKDVVLSNPWRDFRLARPATEFRFCKRRRRFMADSS